MLSNDTIRERSDFPQRATHIHRHTPHHMSIYPARGRSQTDLIDWALRSADFTHTLNDGFMGAITRYLGLCVA